MKDKIRELTKRSNGWKKFRELNGMHGGVEVGR